MQYDKEFKKIVKERLTKDTLNVAWVLRREVGSYTKYELRCNRCEQFPGGYYRLSSANNAYEAKNMLYEELMEKLDETQKI